MKVKKLTDTAIVPTRAYNSVGYDLYSDSEVILKGLDFWPGYNNGYDIQTILADEFDTIATKVNTGIALEIPENHVGLFRDRSSYGSHAIIVGGGVIDPDYRGELIVCLLNINPFEIIIPRGTKIAQMLIVPVALPTLEIVDVLSMTDRANRGFGSSGV